MKIKLVYLLAFVFCALFSKAVNAQEKELPTPYQHYTEEKVLREFEVIKHFTPEKDLAEFRKHENPNDTINKTLAEFQRFEHVEPEKINTEFKKIEHTLEEKELAEFKKTITKPTLLKRKLEFSKIEGKKVDKKLVKNLNNVKVDSSFYSVFTDFRIPVRANINESYLMFAGWQTDSNAYTYRCKNKKRVRLTFWYSKLSGSPEVKGSEFINVTNTTDKCLEYDLIYEHKAPVSFDVIRKKVKIEKPIEPKEEKIKKSKPKKQTFKAWQGLKK